MVDNIWANRIENQMGRLIRQLVSHFGTLVVFPPAVKQLCDVLGHSFITTDDVLLCFYFILFRCLKLKLSRRNTTYEWTLIDGQFSPCTIE